MKNLQTHTHINVTMKMKSYEHEMMKNIIELLNYIIWEKQNENMMKMMNRK